MFSTASAGAQHHLALALANGCTQRVKRKRRAARALFDDVSAQRFY